MRPPLLFPEMRLSIFLGLSAVALIAATVWGVSELPTDSGDVETVESGLAAEAPASTTPSTTPPSTAELEPDARWNPNESSAIAAGGRANSAVPTSLTIDRIGVSAPIGSYGIDAGGQMDVPDNVTDVGWYRFGPRPGEPGSSVLAAHVDLAGPGRGVFFELDELVEGDRIAVGFSDGSNLDFVVVARSTYFKDELPLDVIFSREGPPVLTLVTCGGSFSRSEGSYDSNVVVYAVPVGDGDPLDIDAG